MFGELTFIKVTNILKKNSPINKDIENPEHIWMSYNQIKKSVQNKDFKALTYATAAMLWILDNEK